MTNGDDVSCQRLSQSQGISREAHSGFGTPWYAVTRSDSYRLPSIGWKSENLRMRYLQADSLDDTASWSRAWISAGKGLERHATPEQCRLTRLIDRLRKWLKRGQ